MFLLRSPTANGISAMLRACLIASAKRRWCGAHTPEMRRGVILPRSRNERVQQSDVLVIDVVDLVDAETANLLAPEILLLAGDRLVAAGRTLRCADGTSTSVVQPWLFLCPFSAAVLGCVRWAGCGGAAGSGRTRQRSRRQALAPDHRRSAAWRRNGRQLAGCTCGAGLRAARFSRAFLRFSIFFSFSSMRTVMNFITMSETRRRRSTSLTSSGPR